MNFKKILMLFLMLAMTLVLASCKGGDNTPDDPDTPDDDEAVYTVTVKNTEGNAVEGATVQLFLDGIVPMKSPVATDSEGKVSFKLEKGNYSAKVITVPNGYVAPEAAVTLKDNAAEVILSEYPSYTVYVKNADGVAIAGAQVQLCSETGCQFPKATDADGKVVFNYVADNYKALVLEAEGYVVTDEYFPLENNEVTIILEKE